MVYDLLVRAQQQALVPLHLNLVAATWGYLNFVSGVQYRVQMNVTEQIDEAVLQEVNRLWWQSLQIGYFFASLS